MKVDDDLKRLIAQHTRMEQSARKMGFNIAADVYARAANRVSHHLATYKTRDHNPDKVKKARWVPPPITHAGYTSRVHRIIDDEDTAHSEAA